MEEDVKLIEKVKKRGSETAANQLVSKYYREIYQYVFKQTLDQEQSYDLTQEIFINMLQGLHQFEGSRASFRTWLYKIATYKVVDYFRSKYYKTHRLSIDITDMDFAINEDFTLNLEHVEEVATILEIVHQLETSLQQIFRLKLFADCTFQEIAAILNIPESTVKTKYYRCLKFVRKKVEGECEDGE
ncbi:RNA polymerase sigma factor [Robertmurraya sp. DFI.2.37]|uniref:RNA polymerase sigma factor n=1 Tax=Robertmurraya sp. DFI.2.37 TaxID=3031819 RepID=UPI00124546B9|nr:RNA polymerase sigma factor [Robertmurraya sp. DFI.2.37]MDF1509070.1 RNA polymerase sigma factor [Robertmurraya sp. DFI.2.37]